MIISKNIRTMKLNHLQIDQILLSKERAIIIIFLLLLQINTIISLKTFTYINYQYSYITIKINEAGNNINVFSSYTDGKSDLGGSDSTHDFTRPNEIHINDINQSKINPSYNLNKTENVIKLIWNDNLKVSYIYSIAYLFKNCEKITEIDLSNFDASKTKYIEEMFWNCISLTSINFTNFYTPQVTHMNHLFYNCI